MFLVLKLVILRRPIDLWKEVSWRSKTSSIWTENRGSGPDQFFKNDSLEGTVLESLFNNIKGVQPAPLSKSAGAFCEFMKFLQNTLVTEHIRTITSGKKRFMHISGNKLYNIYPKKSAKYGLLYQISNSMKNVYCTSSGI